METSEILRNISILYVEDDEAAREELYDVLKRRTGKVVVAENGRKGLELYETFQPDIILADLYMPEMGGIEMIHKIREAGGDPLVIVISAADETDTIISAVDAGIVKYILKPVNLKKLLDTLTEMAQTLIPENTDEDPSLAKNKKFLEDRIKKEFASFMKSNTGKGPRDIDVFIHNDQVEIISSEILTVYEKSILDRIQNIAIIENVRRVFYSAVENDICELISSIIGREVKCTEIIVNTKKDSNKLIFTIGRSI